jgi:hypothetical protein
MGYGFYSGKTLRRQFAAGKISAGPMPEEINCARLI